MGRKSYKKAWELQETLAGEIAAGIRPPTLLLLEHPHTYTFGRRGRSENLLWDASELSRRGVGVYWVDRGGDVTYHGPGQLVGYPLLPLASGAHERQTKGAGGNSSYPDFIGYLRQLERMLIQTLARYNIHGTQISGLTGVWVPSNPVHPDLGASEIMPETAAKIAAIGVKVDARGISRHGFALNIDPDMTFWQGIVGCGLEDRTVTSMAELLHSPPSMEKVTDEIVSVFGEIFDYRMQIV
jgi:lipoate-protein ligase B